MQKAYVIQHNLRARDKEFTAGDLVIVLQGDSSFKLHSRWQEPATVTQRLSKNKYTVAFDNGSVRVIHANYLRPFEAGVASLGVVLDPVDGSLVLDEFPWDPGSTFKIAFNAKRSSYEYHSACATRGIPATDINRSVLWLAAA